MRLSSVGQRPLSMAFLPPHSRNQHRRMNHPHHSYSPLDSGFLSPPHCPSPRFSPFSSNLSSTRLAASASPSQVLSTAAAVTTTTTRTSVISLLAAFVAGGLFFSTAIALVGACYGIGIQNVKRVWHISRFILARVWKVFVTGLQVTKATLLGTSTTDELAQEKQSWKWKEAWKVLKEQLSETRKAATEGVEAIRLEAGLYSAAVGTPGLIALQYFVNRLTPLFLAARFREVLQDSLFEMSQDKQQKHISKIQLEDFSIGEQPPELMAARAFDLGTQAMAFDLDIKWESQLLAKVQMTPRRSRFRVPVEVKNVKFHGVIRVVLSPLTDKPPGFGAALVSFPTPPKVGLDVRVAGSELTRIPWLKTEIVSSIQKSIQEQLLWPRRMVIPSIVPPPSSVSKKTLLSKHELEELEISDPLLKAELKLKEQELLMKYQETIQPNVTSPVLDIQMNEELREFISAEEDAILVNGQHETVMVKEESTSTNKRRGAAFWGQRVRQLVRPVPPNEVQES